MKSFKSILLSVLLISMFFACGQLFSPTDDQGKEDEKKEESNGFDFIIGDYSPNDEEFVSTLDLSIGDFEFTELDNPEDYVGSITVWSFTDEVEGMVPYFNEVYPNVEVTTVVISNQDEVYLNQVNSTIGTGVDEPDVFTGEAAFYKQFIDAGYWLPISGPDLANIASDTIPYVLDSSVDSDGLVNALSWQATPGALFYRRSIAEAVLGTDDPVAVSEYTSDLRKFYELGTMVRETFNGEKFLLAGYNDMSQFMYNLRTEPYIVDNNFSIPPNLIDYMNIAKNMRDNGLEAGHGTWQPGWFSGMSDGSVMCYLLPTWGLHYVLKPNAEPEANNGEVEFSGDWGLAVPPASYKWGGTWIGVNRYTEKVDLSYLFVRFIGANKDFLTEWATETGDFVSNMDVINDVAPGYSDPFLGGQNHYSYFASEANKIDVSARGPWDYQIENIWGEQIDDYVNGYITLEEAIDNLKTEVNNIISASNYPNSEPEELVVNTIVNGSFVERNDVDVYSIAFEAGNTYTISIEDEFSGLPNGADTIVEIYYGDSEYAEVIKRSKEEDPNLFENPIILSVEEDTDVTIRLISDNPDTTYYKLLVSSDDFI